MVVLYFFWSTCILIIAYVTIIYLNIKGIQIKKDNHFWNLIIFKVILVPSSLNKVWKYNLLYIESMFMLNLHVLRMRVLGSLKRVCTSMMKFLFTSAKSPFKTTKTIFKYLYKQNSINKNYTLLSCLQSSMPVFTM